MLEDYRWDLSGYTQEVCFQSSEGITCREAEHIFQLKPEPPTTECLNDYILLALQKKNLDYFSFFLHHYEGQLNQRIRSFLRLDGTDGYDPERFLDIKLSCLEIMLHKLPDYDSKKGAEFATYIYPFIRDAWLQYRMQEEPWSISSLSAYKNIRRMAWLSHNTNAPLQSFADQQQCDIALAEEYLKASRQLRSRQPFYVTSQDEDGEETGEDVTRDDNWNYADILWNGMQATAVQTAFAKLNYREQMLLEKRNAICMTCGRVSPLSTRSTFEELAVLFEGSSASGAERAYARALDRLTHNLVEDGALCVVELKRKSQRKKGKKIAVAVYEYRADYDGEWGEIQFDFVQGIAEILKLAELDTVKSNTYAKRVISHILSLPVDDLPKKLTLPFER